jgi:transcriptional regulator with AAA-type ATPase domain
LPDCLWLGGCEGLDLTEMVRDPRRVPSGETTRPSRAPSLASRPVGESVRWLHPVADGELVMLAGPRMVLGRGDDCEVRLASAEVSRHHAELRREGPLLIIRDLGSMNGVFVNGQRVGEAVLSVGDLVRLGEWIGLIVEGFLDRSPPAEAFTYEHGLVIGPALRPCLEIARTGATTDLPVVIQGESGTGKELVARAVHAWSRRSGPLLAVNCAALPEALAEAALFGHRKGAFTGAVSDSLGYFRAARGGTLFLDEIPELPPALQAKLLRALEQHEVLPVGESLPVRIDVRVVAATQVPLSERVREQEFRRDLAARLDGIIVVLPSLRDRVAEIPRLFQWFLRKHGGDTPPEPEPLLVEALCLYDWPCNVRELEHLVRRLVGLNPAANLLKVTHLPDQMRGAGGARGAEASLDGSADGFGAREARDFAALLRSLRAHGGNVSRAAAEAGVSRQRAYRLLEAHPELDLKSLRVRFPLDPDEDADGR